MCPTAPISRASFGAVSLPLFFVALLPPLPAPLSAQQAVRGVVYERASGAPVPAAMVVLLEGEQPIGRTLTNAQGAFVLPAPRPGRLVLRIDRIGYASTHSEPFDLGAGEVVERDVRTEVQAVELAGIDVEGARRCELLPAAGLATAVVWEEARKALEAAAWTAERGMYRFAWSHFVRILDEDGRRVLGEERTVRRELAPRPFTAVDAGVLSREGFLRSEGGRLLYAAPDAEVLLSDPFLDTHCFFLDPGRIRADGLLGLRFEPVPGRRVTEVEGVLWLEEGSARLRSIEYRYVQLPWSLDDHGAGGEVFLTELPNGTWIVRDWRIRMPRVREERNELGQVLRHAVAGYQEEGGVVELVTTATGEVVERDVAAGGIRGVVTDSLGRPAEGARVWMAGTDRVASSGPDGRFAFHGVAAGVWTVGTSHPDLEALGHGGTFQEVEVERGSLSEAFLALPSVRGVAMELCAEPRPASAARVLAGRVTDEVGRPVPGADVRALWVSGGAHEGVGLRTGQHGLFAACAVPATEALRAWATSGAMASRVVEVAPGGSEFFSWVELGLASAEAPGADVPVAGDPVGEDLWLASKGFHLRAGTALLHQTGWETSAPGLTRLEQVLRQAPRLEARPLVTGRTEYRLREDEVGGVGAEACELDFYLNGSLLRQRVDPDIRDLDVDRIVEPRHLTGIEVFDAERAPVGEADGCGAALLWVHRLQHRQDPEFTGGLAVRVVRPPGTVPAADLRVVLLPGGREGRTDAEGRVDFGALPPAPYRLDLDVPGWGVWSADVAVRAYRDAEVVVELEIETAEQAVASSSPGHR